jgi:hypothetical protein
LKKGTYRLAGCPSGGSYSKYRFSVKDPNASGDIASDVGNGQTFTLTEDKDVVLYLQVSTTGTTVENLTFKPMLTTDLQATYDDFVGYTGGTGRLNSDVAEHEKEISRINSELTDISSRLEVKHTTIQITTSSNGYFDFGSFAHPILSAFVKSNINYIVHVGFNSNNGRYMGFITDNNVSSLVANKTLTLDVWYV